MPKMSEETKAKRAAARQAEQEARVAQEAAWEDAKSLRLLNAMARAAEIPGAEISVFYRYDDVLHYSYRINPADSFDNVGTYAELSEHIMQLIEGELYDQEERIRRESHLNKVKEDLLKRLTDEEKEALGIY